MFNAMDIFSFHQFLSLGIWTGLVSVRIVLEKPLSLKICKRDPADIPKAKWLCELSHDY